MKNMQQKAVAAGAALAIVVGALAVRQHSLGSASRDASQGPRQRYGEGARLVYGVTWTAATHGSVAPAQGSASATAIAMETDVEAEISITALGERGSGEQLAFTCDKMKRFHFRMQEQDVALDEAKVARELEGQSAYVTVDARGQVRGIGFSSDATVPARNFLRAVVQQMQLTLPPLAAPEWDAAESTPLGLARVHYTRAGAQLTRKRLAYTSLEAMRNEPLDGAQVLQGSAALEVDESELLRSVRETESVRYTRPASTLPELVADWSFTAERRTVEKADPRAHRVAMTAAPVQQLADKVKDPGFEARREAGFAEGVTELKLLQEIDRHQGGARPAHDFMVKAGAFLRLHPEVDATLVEQFRSSAVDLKGRGFILDMLAQAGDAKAQKAMLDALGSPAAHAKDKDFSMLVQRFIFVSTPTPESAAYLAGVYDQSRRSSLADAQGAVTALGSTIDHLGRSGNESLAREYNGKLRDELSRAETPDLQRALLAALGNAKREENVPVIAALAKAEDPLVRAQAASALRSVPSDEARHTLLGMASDYDTAVALNAFASLRGQQLAAEDWARLHGMVDGKVMNSSADLPLVQLIRDHRTAAGDEGAQMLQALLARNGGGENDVGTIIRQMLEPQDGNGGAP